MGVHFYALYLSYGERCFSLAQANTEKRSATDDGQIGLAFSKILECSNGPGLTLNFIQYKDGVIISFENAMK